MKGDDIAERLLDFSAEVVVLVRGLPADVAGRHVARQLIRAGTAGGANYAEARSAESRVDFAHKALIAAKEVRESVYWLRLIERAQLTKTKIERVVHLVDEGDELTAILTASARTARARAAANKSMPF
jgi:four helix bundle protein